MTLTDTKSLDLTVSPDTRAFLGRDHGIILGGRDVAARGGATIAVRDPRDRLRGS